ncbi:50S ribosomal protein L28 [Columbia Basin potato purple top phytoplasma]|uniref:Large ribosomal subunit protein bL28 n=1 Tax=Columbia Basin potato purple top phytoplasma TaxID=307134 RepID=A0ABT5L9B5_9MOLU|nr:50S ribosomal protein L28 [Columbia Basin potato purple top phytoplasma]MDC9032123.1 50S ribosomal protein L28 [Columbia Basin potato purple top phytoplasma]
MSKCYITGKTTLFGNKRSHAMNATRKLWKANLQKVNIIDQKGKKKKVYISARALRKLELQRV